MSENKLTSFMNKKDKFSIYNKIVILIVIAFLIIPAFTNLDFDGDSISNYQELRYNSSIWKKDTSGDGIQDDVAIKYWLDPTVSYPPSYVNFFKEIKNDYSTITKHLGLTLFKDDELSPSESEFLDDIKDIKNYHRIYFPVISNAILNDFTISSHEHSFLKHYLHITEEYPGSETQIFSRYVSDEEISELDNFYLQYLDNNTRYKGAFLGKSGRLSTEEFKFIERMAENPQFETRIEKYGFFDDGMITWREIFLANDSDSDGLLNVEEEELGTGIFDSDTDGDGLKDGAEMLKYGTDPKNPDSDEDMITDGKELRNYETDPLNNDTDGDGLFDGEEIFDFWSDPLDPDPDLYELKSSLDKDGQLNEFEIKYIRLIEKNPHNISHQILNEGYHKNGSINSDQLRSVSDPDEDGIITINEKRIGTNQYNPDTDRDGLLDGWEVYGVQREGMRKIPLDKFGADPLHKDIFVEIIGDIKLSEKQREKIIGTFKNAPIENPDGNRGINIHLDDDTPGNYFGGNNTEITQYPVPNLANGIEEEHPRWGFFYFGRIMESIEYAGIGDIGGDNFIVSSNYYKTNSTYFTKLFIHEIGHNILGFLKEENRLNRNILIHSRYEDNIMYPQPGGETYHPNVWQEINEDGLLGLPFRGRVQEIENLDWHIYYSD